MITQAQLKELLTYDPLTGVFRWRLDRRKTKIGQVAGTTRRSGYVLIAAGGKQIMAHRLAWLYMTGAWPVCGIDHKNQNPNDNRFENLREANQSQNIANIIKKKNNKTGIRGISRRRGKYRVALHKNGKQVGLGDHLMFCRAVKVARDASLNLHGQFSIHSRLV